MQIRKTLASLILVGLGCAYADQAAVPAGLMASVGPVIPKSAPLTTQTTTKSSNGNMSNAQSTLSATPATRTALNLPASANFSSQATSSDNAYSNGAATPPEVVNVSNQDKYTVQLSSTDPNMLTVRGDKITDITCPSNSCYVKNLQNDATGSAYISILNNASFTAFVSTAANRHFSLWVLPTDEPGKTIVFNPLDGAMGVAGHFEKNTDYEELLINLTQDMEKGQVPDGYGLLDLSGQKSFKLPNGLEIQPVSAMTGTYVSALHFSIKNTTQAATTLREEEFNHPGVRAISIEGAMNLMPGGVSNLYEIISNPNQ